MKNLLTIALMAIIALPSAESVKCYSGGNAPYKSDLDTDVPGGVCVRYRYGGSATLTHVPVSSETFEQMKAQPSVFSELFGCRTDYCNYTPPVAETPSTIVTIAPKKPLRCYSSLTSQSGKPVKLKQAFPAGHVCVRYKNVDTKKTVYTAVPFETYNQIRGMPAWFTGVFGCAKDYCNGPVKKSGSVLPASAN